jgi:hypothetical protein
MNKSLVIVSALIFAIMLLAVPAGAHYSGVIEDFLVGVSDNTSSDRLRGEIEKTRKEIADLAPQLEQLKQGYELNQKSAVTKLLFYHSIGPDAYLNFIMQSGNIVDIVANQHIVKRQLENDLEQLNDVYLQYRQVKSATETLEGHETLLQAIQTNLQARARFLDVTKNFSVEKTADAALNVWNDKAVIYIERNLKADAQYIKENLQQLLARESNISPYRLEEDKLNQFSNLTYLIRSDHVYVQYVYDDGTSTILMGTFSNQQDGTASLKFESGFVEGIVLSEDLVSQLPGGLEIQLSQIQPKASGFTVEQTNGAIVLLPVVPK